MARFPEAEARLFKNMYICMKCNARNRVDPRKVRLGKAKCRECGHNRLRQKKRAAGK
ncbi:TPA: 50S ribosomal protein L40e [archaeon]|uniref:50S ribosomal protein L40e n=1 Tax=Candidatus Naiadarchaeum limnaeum TaxID=2756139 RepID=A0A832UZN7_9ARCH|nr:50S ribosomal protein L40e [Candidatus Naiadarchaeum limnaeum]